jgi:hypothetical protein
MKISEKFEMIRESIPILRILTSDYSRSTAPITSLCAFALKEIDVRFKSYKTLLEPPEMIPHSVFEALQTLRKAFELKHTTQKRKSSNDFVRDFNHFICDR